MNRTAKYSAPALDKGLDILEHLSDNVAPLSQAEIATGLGRSPNEIYRVLVGLEARGYILRDESSGKYRLSLKLYTLSHTHSPIEQLTQAAQLPMMELAETVGQSCHLSVPYEGKLMVVSQVKSPEPVSLSISEGTLFPLFSTTSGRVLLAHYSEEQLEKLLIDAGQEPHLSAEQKQQLLAELETIRRDRYHFAPSDITMGVTDCAAFVGMAGSGLTAAVAASSLTSTLGRHHDRESIVAAVLATADKINQRLGTHRAG
ncbi:IclR family transcriptional regulator [Marinimicrobium agarilyticum]|uniref:IclR family transcriptional regulator n=1 Tax=Marinimicrobium agarilyticum TaxID=306546 RepID=UPI0004030B95|nr:IclR family transcriptional regulator [Marinimicrobium agarilyticum]